MRISDKNCKFFSNNATLTAFLTNVRKYNVPSVEEEEKLINEYKDGNIEAGKELVCCHLRFIYALAKIYARDENEVVDYVNEGVIGFMTALQEFDLSRGYKFITYAVWYIRRSMNFYLTNTRDMVIRTNAAKIGKKIDNIKQKMFVVNGREPSIEEIKEILKTEYKIDVKYNKDVYDINVASINDNIDDEYTMEDFSEYASKTATANDYENTVEHDYKYSLIKSAMSILPEKYVDVLKMLYGIDYDREYSIQEVGEKYKIRALEVAKMRDKAIKYIQQNIEKVKRMAL